MSADDAEVQKRPLLPADTPTDSSIDLCGEQLHVPVIKRELPLRLIKAMDGPSLILWGSSTLTSMLLEHGLADEVLLFVYPILLGKGKRFFSDGTPPSGLALTSTNAVSSGVLISTYTPAGPLRAGSYADPA
jgi:dihydrofolate reductase